MNEMKKTIIVILMGIVVGVLLAACGSNNVSDDEKYASRYISENVFSALLNNDVNSVKIELDDTTMIELEKRNVNKDWFIIREYELQEGTYEEVDAIIATCNHPKEFSEKAKLIDEQIDRLLD